MKYIIYMKTYSLYKLNWKNVNRDVQKDYTFIVFDRTWNS